MIRNILLCLLVSSQIFAQEPNQTKPVQSKALQWFLVSESWCANCPAAKKKFLEKGWPESNVITMAECQRRFGFKPPYVPYEFGEPQIQSSATKKPVTVVPAYTRLPIVKTPWGVQDLETYERRHIGCNCPMCQGIRGIIAGYRSQQQIVPVQELRLDPSVQKKIPTDEVIQFGQENTPWPVIEKMVQLMDLKSGDCLADLGCGDGRVLIAAVTMTGCRGIGVEIDKTKCEQAIRNIETAGLSAKITVIHGDILEFNPQDQKVTAITAYLYPELLAKIPEKIRMSRVATFPYHSVPGMELEKHGDVWVFRNNQKDVN